VWGGMQGMGYDVIFRLARRGGAGWQAVRRELWLCLLTAAATTACPSPCLFPCLCHLADVLPGLVCLLPPSIRSCNLALPLSLTAGTAST
jgi:hypothetical protein